MLRLRSGERSEFGMPNAIPLIRRLDLEASATRSVSRTLVGGTRQSKVGFTWIVRGSGGPSRLMELVSASPIARIFQKVASSRHATLRCPAQLPPFPSCRSQRTPTAGSLAQAFAAVSDAAVHLVASALRRHRTVVRNLRRCDDRPSYQPRSSVNLKPGELDKYSIAQTCAADQFLRGLDLQATWYSVKIQRDIARVQQSRRSSVGDPNSAFHISCQRPGCPVARMPTPALCTPFQLMVSGILNNSKQYRRTLSSQTSSTDQ